MICPVDVDVTHEVARCVDFAMEMGRLNQAHEYNNAGTSQRQPSEVAHDNLVGKIAEVAVHQLLTSLGAFVEAPDFRIFGASKRDDHDLVSLVNGKSVSVKSTARGRFLFIHEGQARWNRPNAYIVCRTVLEGEKPSGIVRILAFAGFHDLFNESVYKQWIDGNAEFSREICGPMAGFVLAGERSPAGDFLQQSTNVFADSNSLRKDLRMLVNALNKPKD